MAPSRPEAVLKKEPLQWGRDFCEELLAFLRDPEIPAPYKGEYCRYLRRDLAEARRSLQGVRVLLAGGSLTMVEGYPALRLLILHLLEVYLPREGEDGQQLLHAVKKIDFLRILLAEMETTLEAGPPWPEFIRKSLTLLKEKGLGAWELLRQLPLQGKVPLSAYILPYGQPGSPACYLKDIHAVLLFRNGQGGWGAGVGAGAGAGYEAGEELEGFGFTGGAGFAGVAGVAGETVFLHELGHALFARMVWEESGEGAGVGAGRGAGAGGRRFSAPPLLDRCLTGALTRMRREGEPEGEQGAVRVREAPALLAENFCHVFVRIILSGSDY